MDTTQPILFLYDAAQQLQGVLLSPELWAKIEPQVRGLLPKAEPEVEELPPEPLKDWNMLVDFWDFKYPVNFEVACDHCGQTTENWQHDEPRKFWLKVANLGGLVTFECMSCHSRILKRHFKDKIASETQVFHAQKDDRWIGVYGKEG